MALQMPFQLNFLLKFSSKNPQIHYLNVDHNQLPINLKQYDQDQVIRIEIDNSDMKRFLLNQNRQIDFKIWNKFSNYIDLQINQPNLKLLTKKYPKLKYDVIIKDLPQTVFETYPNSTDLFHELNQFLTQGDDISTSSDEFSRLSEMMFHEYRPLSTINAWLEILQQSYPDVIKIETIGQTYEHREYKVIHFAAPNDDVAHDERKTMVITGGIHAREWISTSSILYILYQLLQAYIDDPNSEQLKNLNFLLIPVANPDGYEYTWTNDRLWRKNRQETIHPQCFGIDIDHSYDYHWTKSSDWPCGEEYSGEEAGEAIEYQIWESYLNSTNGKHRISCYIDLHSYSQEILYPYAYSCQEEPRDKENLIELAYGMAKTIRLFSGKNYNVLPACIDRDSDLTPDLGSGSALDFMYHNRAYWAYQIKLRDTGSHGFLLPAKYIEPVGKEIYAGIKYFCSFILSDDR